MKGQLSVEYMTLYGWVLLFGMLALGLLYFLSGSFRPAAFEAKCVIFSVVDCTEKYLKLESESPTKVNVTISIKNTGQDIINITRLEVYSDPSNKVTLLPSSGHLTLSPYGSERLSGIVDSFAPGSETYNGGLLRLYLNGTYNVCTRKTGSVLCSNSEFVMSGEIVDRIN